jgi:hypothetical protein
LKKKFNGATVTLAAFSIALFLTYVPAFPVQNTIVTGRRAELVCAALGRFYLSRPQFIAHNTGYASATYVLLGYGTGPQRHYPLEITVYVTNASTNVTTRINVFLRDEYTACLEFNIDQPRSCVS